MNGSPLSGLRVIELGASLATAYCGRLFSDLGAEVIKVEPPEGDRLRTRGPFPGDLPDPECSGLFVYFHGGKKSVVLDRDVTALQRGLARPLEESDVLLEDRDIELGGFPLLDADRVRERCPRLVHIVLSPFGASGPYAQYKGNAFTAWAMSGLMYATGDPGREPLANGCDPAEFFAGEQALLAALAAIEARERSGVGDRIDLSMAECMTAADDYTADLYAGNGSIRTRYYSRHIWGFPNDILPCKGGYVTVLASGADANALALLVDRPELESHELFRDRRARQVRQQEYIDLIQPWLNEHTADEVLEKAQILGIPFAQALDIPGLSANEHLRARGFFRHVQQPCGTFSVPGPAYEFSRSALDAVRPAPALDADRAAVLGEGDSG